MKVSVQNTFMWEVFRTSSAHFYSLMQLLERGQCLRLQCCIGNRKKSSDDALKHDAPDEEGLGSGVVTQVESVVDHFILNTAEDKTPSG